MGGRVCGYHCGGCHAHFASLEAFDAHRTGSYSDGRRCEDPDDVPALAVVTTNGVCRMYRQPIEGVVIYTSRRSVGRAAHVFRKAPQRLAVSHRSHAAPNPGRVVA